MKALIVLFVSLAIAAGSVYAGCGKKVTSSGTLKSYDKEAKSIVVEEAGGKSTTITLTPSTATTDAAGKVAKVENLVGKMVSVVSEHNKADSVTQKETKKT